MENKSHSIHRTKKHKKDKHAEDKVKKKSKKNYSNETEENVKKSTVLSSPKQTKSTTPEQRLKEPEKCTPPSSYSSIEDKGCNKSHTTSSDKAEVVGDVQKVTCAESDSSKVDDKKDYLLRYVDITTFEQRQTYKEDFEKEYAEYKDVYLDVTKVSNLFQNLHDRLNKATADSPEWEAVAKDLISAYNTYKKDSEYFSKKNRWQYLQQKLGHIKSLVAAFDKKY